MVANVPFQELAKADEGECCYDFSIDGEQYAFLEFHAVREFVERVNRRAEENMEKTGKLEGAHYAAMRLELEKLEKGIQDEG